MGIEIFSFCPVKRRNFRCPFNSAQARKHKPRAASASDSRRLARDCVEWSKVEWSMVEGRRSNGRMVEWSNGRMVDGSNSRLPASIEASVIFRQPDHPQRYFQLSGLFSALWATDFSMRAVRVSSRLAPSIHSTYFAHLAPRKRCERRLRLPVLRERSLQVGRNGQGPSAVIWRACSSRSPSPASYPLCARHRASQSSSGAW